MTLLPMTSGACRDVPPRGSLATNTPHGVTTKLNLQFKVATIRNRKTVGCSRCNCDELSSIPPYCALCQLWARRNCLALCCAYLKERFLFPCTFIPYSAWLLRYFNPLHSGHAMPAFPCTQGVLWMVHNSTTTLCSATDCLGLGCPLGRFSGVRLPFSTVW